MKSSIVKKILLTLAMFTVVFMLFSVTAFADDYGNFSYTLVAPEAGEDFASYNEIAGYNAGDDATDTVVTIPSEIEDVPVTKICASAFNGQSTLTEIIIPDSVTTIANAAFYNCTALKTVVIPDSVTFIGESAFQGCTSLENVIIGDSVISVGDIAFKGCVALKNVDLGTSVEEIGSGAFFDCESLKSVYIPDSVKTIGSLAFGYIQNGDEESVVDGFVLKTNANAEVYAYAGAKEESSDSESVADITVAGGIVACADDAHDGEFVKVRVATDAYEGLEMAVCGKCNTIVTKANTDVAPVEKSISDYIVLIVIAVAVIACAIFFVWYVKKAKANRAKAIEEYKAGKTLSDMELKKKYDAKIDAKYQKKRAKQEKRLEIFKDK